MTVRRTRLLVTLFASAMLLTGTVPSLAAYSHKATAPLGAARGACAPNKQKFIVSVTTFRSNSPTFVDVPETNITFTQGSTTPACAIISFSSEAGADAGVA